MPPGEGEQEEGLQSYHVPTATPVILVIGWLNRVVWFCSPGVCCHGPVLERSSSSMGGANGLPFASWSVNAQLWPNCLSSAMEGDSCLILPPEELQAGQIKAEQPVPSGCYRDGKCFICCFQCSLGVSACCSLVTEEAGKPAQFIKASRASFQYVWRELEKRFFFLLWFMWPCSAL